MLHGILSESSIKHESVFMSVSCGHNEAHFQAARSKEWSGMVWCNNGYIFESELAQSNLRYCHTRWSDFIFAHEAAYLFVSWHMYLTALSSINSHVPTEGAVYWMMPVATPVSAHLDGLVRAVIQISMIVFNTGVKMEPLVWMRLMVTGECFFDCLRAVHVPECQWLWKTWHLLFSSFRVERIPRTLYSIKKFSLIFC